jgi:DNA-binding protein HU-alpha
MSKVINLQDADKSAAKKPASKAAGSKATTAKRSSVKTTQPKTVSGKAKAAKDSAPKAGGKEYISAKPAKSATPVEAPATDTAAAAPMAGLAPVIPVSGAVAAEPKLVTSSVPVTTGPEMKKRDLLDKVVKRSGVKKKDAKLVVEAMLAVLGEAMAEGRELVLQPMGRLKTTRIKDTGNGRVLICKLRQGGGGGNADKESLADDED